MMLLLGKRFSVLQWASMALLGVSLCVAKLQMLLPEPSCASLKVAGESNSASGDNAGLFALGITLVLAASFISGLAGVSNELLLKKRDKDVGLWRKNIWTYQWGVIFNAVGLMTSELFSSSPETVETPSVGIIAGIFRGYDFWVWAMIFVTALLGISVSMIMKYFDNVVKCFGGSIILYGSTAASMIFFGSKVDASFVLGLMIISISSYFYAGDFHKKLDVYTEFERDIEAMVKTKTAGSVK